MKKGKEHTEYELCDKSLCEENKTEILKNLPKLGKEYMKRFRRQLHIKKYNREYMREYNKRPYAKKKRIENVKKYQQIPEIKAHRKEYAKNIIENTYNDQK